MIIEIGENLKSVLIVMLVVIFNPFSLSVIVAMVRGNK